MPRGNGAKKRANARRKHSKKYGQGFKIHQYFVLRNTSCGICNQYMRFEDVTLDHITPLGKGGVDRKKNWQLAHKYCNENKGDKA